MWASGGNRARSKILGGERNFFRIYILYVGRFRRNVVGEFDVGEGSWYRWVRTVGQTILKEKGNANTKEDTTEESAVGERDSKAEVSASEAESGVGQTPGSASAYGA